MKAMVIKKNYNLKSVKDKIIKAKEIVVAGHINPDGDSIGSLLALGLGIESLGKRVHMISPEGVPKRYRLLPGARRIRKYIKNPAAIDLAVSVDCSNKELLGSAYRIFKDAKKIIEIDHHEFRRPFGGILLIDNKAAAVGEIIYTLLKELNVRIANNIAQNLITSIVVETDSFRLPTVRPLTFEICQKLMSKGVNFYKLVDMVFWSRTKEAVILSGICLSRCKFLKDERIAWSIITKKDFLLVKGKSEDVDAVADQMRSIQNVKIAVLFREENKNSLRVSLRSKDKINIGAIAEYFGGGGHYDVAGCSIPNSRESIRKLLTRTKSILSKTGGGK